VIVVDASALLELLLRTPKAAALDALLLDPATQLHAPHLIDVEILETLRRLTLGRAITSQRAELALQDAGLLVIERHAHVDLGRRTWALRDSLTACDALYVVLAEALEAPLVTCDARLARAHGHRARITVV
jgi:predicted nucleic acid-binding protein